ncbi:glucosamine--fructose-6-phosphate aminotransferase [Amycolatopsis taiwanensis]|uniref:Glucosamine--fructose-6-phosphate aminotransferase n=1 Tax=Amycolatopsis taiwanensis TaxID=342230 RepID=A0A9W6RAC8_9PSEU|nr:glucosamine--fructose-6-phosphate aminotransferase [Amycolatopsis taiwanensis]
MQPHVIREIRRQPESWCQALRLLPGVRDALPRDGERVAVLGCGTSWFMAVAYAALREAAGAGETDAFPASQFPAARRYDRIVVISRSGTTTEIVRAIDGITVPVTAVTAVEDSPVARAATDEIVLGFADERSVVQTLFATTALMLLRGSLGEPLDDVIEQAAAVLGAGAALPAEVENAEQFTFLGNGWRFGVGLEAGLKVREAARLWSEAYPQLEYRHGPISIAQPGRAVWVFGAAEEGILTDVAATGAVVVADDLDPVADLVRVQSLAARRAVAAGLDPDHPRSLTRSVVLAEPA